ncbi:MAG: hypothetical protein U0931_13315 [Vulcanimicrobiota bacterium]
MDKLRLNTINRFSKHSPHLVLEQHGNCEVPAGCGGVAFRWLNPAHEAYLLLTLYSPGQARAYLDGEPLYSGAFSVPVGPHVLALELENSACFWLALQRNPRPNQKTLLLSQADGSWRATIQSPGPEWNRAEWQSSWPGLEELLSPPECGGWRWEDAKALGARALGVEGAQQLWVSKAFDL